MVFLTSTPVLIRHLCLLKALVFLHWCLICVVILSEFARKRIKVFIKSSSLVTKSALTSFIAMTKFDFVPSHAGASIVKLFRVVDKLLRLVVLCLLVQNH
jgi:hypothetical protein